MKLTIHLLILPLLALHLAACYTTSPTYGSRTEGRNGTSTFHDPAYETSINPFGWSLVLLTTAGGAYAGHESGIALEWESGEPATEKPIVNAAIGGVTAGVATMIFNAVFKPDEKRYSRDEPAEWLRQVDDDLILAGLTKMGAVLAVADTADRSFVAASMEDLRLFRRLFPESPYTERVGRGAIPLLPRDTLPAVPRLYAGEPWSEEARLRFVDETVTLTQSTEAVALYPDLADRIAARAVTQVKNVKDAQLFAKTFPSSPHASAIVRAVLPTARRADVESLLITFPDGEAQTILRRALFDSTRSVAEVIAMTERFPELRGEGERKAAMVATTAGDYRLYLATFPNGADAGSIKLKLGEMLRVPENLGREVNSRYSELAPIVTPDGNQIYYVQRDHPDNQGWRDADDVVTAFRDSLDRWGDVSRLPAPINNDENNSISSVTPDNNLMLLLGDYDGSSNPLSISVRTENGWSIPVSQQIDKYYNQNTYNNFVLSADGKTLVMAIERKDSYGDLDIYVSFLKDDNRWTEPMNLGKTVNSKGTDFSPFLAADGVSLYYASDGKGGLGDSDILLTRRLDNTWKKWSEPKGLGKPINTEDWDAYLTIPASGDYAYFVSATNAIGGSDIFRVALPDDLRPLPVVLIAGTVRDRSDGEPLDAVIVYENLATGEEVGRARTDPATGAYKITLPPGANYGFRAEAADYIAVNDNLDLSELKVYREQTRDLLLVPLRAGEELRLNNLFFDVGKATLRKESHPELNRLAEIMRGRAAMTITIEGHTDSVGAEEDNLRLSNARAEAVASYLASRGVGRGRLHPIGKGESEPLESNATEAGKALNRRVEIVIGM